MTPQQLRMARAALKLTVRDVERLTGVNKDTVSRYEADREIVASALQKLEKLFRDEGIIFVDEDASGGEGVRLPLRILSRRSPRRVTDSKSEKRSQKAK
jgi:transcriptional regulator with XRE-family HTH domain